MKIRLQKFMADCGVASRRKCEEMITTGQVRINGDIQTALPILIDPTADDVVVGDERLEPIERQQHAYYLLHKPKGVLVTNHDPANRKTVGELMTGVSERVFPVGRLDMDSRGLLLMTNDGELSHRLTHPRFGVEKTYIVRVDGRLGAQAIESLRQGVWLGPDRGSGPGVKSEGLRLRLLARERADTVLEVRIAESRNREIRRVLARTGHKVRDLFRVAMAEKITIKGLEPGQFRKLTEKEVEWLRKASSSDFHDKKRAATQAWYENKEMQKERRRIETEAGPRQKTRSAQPTTVQVSTEQPAMRRPSQPRPPRRFGPPPFGNARDRSAAARGPARRDFAGRSFVGRKADDRSFGNREFKRRDTGENRSGASDRSFARRSTTNQTIDHPLSRGERPVESRGQQRGYSGKPNRGDKRRSAGPQDD